MICPVFWAAAVVSPSDRNCAASTNTAMSPTEIVRAGVFYPAEDYHQGYFRNNPNQPYCRAVIAPKVAKLRSKYLAKLKA